MCYKRGPQRHTLFALSWIESGIKQLRNSSQICRHDDVFLILSQGRNEDNRTEKMKDKWVRREGSGKGKKKVKSELPVNNVELERLDFAASGGVAHVQNISLGMI